MVDLQKGFDVPSRWIVQREYATTNANGRNYGVGASGRVRECWRTAKVGVKNGVQR